jgi:hypothetical protein
VPLCAVHLYPAAVIGQDEDKQARVAGEEAAERNQICVALLQNGPALLIDP